MAEHFYISDNIEKLSSILAKNRKSKTDIFQKETLITQTKGMNMWLSSELATKNKIFANFSFISPQHFIASLFRLCEINTNYDYATGKLTWEIYYLLNDSEFIASFSFVANYYLNDDVKRFQLAAKTADLFDQYMVYRSSYIRNWNQQQHPDIESEELQSDFRKHEAWQFWLWNKIKQINTTESPDQVELIEQLDEVLTNGQFNNLIKNTFPSLSFFGITVLTTFHHRIFKKLSTIIDISYYLLAPTLQNNWWQNDYQYANDILANCHTTGKNTFEALLANAEVTAMNIEETNRDPKNLLESLQLDILKDSNNNIKKLVFESITDNSLQIASNYSPVREVEALYNYILNALENDKQITIKDISVQLTDVALYAPYIKAVFDNGPVSIPYVICDVSYTDGDTLSNALESFFRIGIDNFSNESVMRLLESKHVQSKYSLSDLETLRHLLNDANIRLGIDGRKDDETYLQSWNHGLTKLILGYAIKGGPKYEYNGENYYLTDSAEEGEAHYIFRLHRLFKTLSALHQEMQKGKSLEAWKDFLLKSLLPSLFDLNDENAEELEYMQQQIATLSFYAHKEGEISFAVIKQAVLESLKRQTRNSNYLSGKLTFSSMLPVRSIPYKVIAILGLNNDSFPRKQQPSGFDLINFEPQKGDRNIKDNDKYLFLESILAARKYLYLSYIGLSAKDNTELPPSLLIEELFEYLSLNATPINNHIWVKHPLHGFNKKYLGEESRLYTYLQYTSNQYNTHTEELPSGKDTRNKKIIAFRDFIRFYKEPVKWYYNKTLGIYYGNDEENLAEHEVFEHDKLESWKLKFDLLQLSDDKKEEYINKNKSRGFLPLKNMANVNLESSHQEIYDLKERYQSQIKGYEEKSEDFELQLGEFTLRGAIDHLFGAYHIYTNVSNKGSQPKYLQEAYLRHIILSAIDNPHMTIFMNMEENIEIAKKHLSNEQAKSILKELCAWMEVGSSEVIVYSPKSAKSFLVKDIDKAVDCLERETEYDPYLAKEIEKGLFNTPEGFNSDASIRISELIFGSFTPEIVE